MPLNPLLAYNNLVANPGGFLKTYPVRIFGDTGVSGQVNYNILNRGASKRPGSVLGNLKMHTTESFDIRSGGAMMGVAAGTVTHIFAAHSIHMDVGVPAMVFYLLGAGGANIMVTGQLSGCSFVMIPGAIAGQVSVAHVKPQAMTGQALFGAMTAAHPNAEVYGAGDTGAGNYDSGDRVASILGVRTGGQWRIYAQKQDVIAGDYRIKSAYQIYPNRQKL